jgi:uncharacterized protein (TIGR02301 family)
MRSRLAPLLALPFLLASSLGANAVDPPYEAQMEQLSQVMGSLYFLAPLCAPGGADWRSHMADLIRLDQPDDDRQQRLYGAFNTGYTAYSRLYRQCTPSAKEALTRLLTEASQTARDIHSHYAE